MPRVARSRTGPAPSVPPLRAREDDPVRVAAPGLPTDGVLDRLAAQREVRSLEEEQRRPGAELQVLGDLARRPAARLGDVRRPEHHVAGHELTPGPVAHRHHVADRADHAELPVTARGGGRERAPTGVAVESSFLDEDVERLPDGRAAHLEAGAERVLGGDALALVAQLVADGVGDLQIAGNAGAVIQRERPPAVRMSRHVPPRAGCRQISVRGPENYPVEKRRALPMCGQAAAWMLASIWR